MYRMMFIFTSFISFVVGSPFALQEQVKGVGNVIQLNKFLEILTLRLGTRRRLSENFSDDCKNDILEHGIGCVLNPDYDCGGFHTDYAKWVIQIDHDTEYMCFPSACTGSDLEFFFSSELTHLNASARYCSLDCPPINFDISGFSDEGEQISISGMYHYANLSYDCAGAAALTEISWCEETGSCPSDATGLTTCTIHFEDSLTYAHMDRTWRDQGKVCLPDQCTNEENLERMEDFFYAFLRYYWEYEYGLLLTSEQIRDGYLVDYVCPGSGSNLSQYVTIFGIITGLLFIICLGALCILRLYRGVSPTPIVAIEFHNLGTFVRLGSLQENERGRDVAERGNETKDGESDHPC